MKKETILCEVFGLAAHMGPVILALFESTIALTEKHFISKMEESIFGVGLPGGFGSMMGFMNRNERVPEPGSICDMIEKACEKNIEVLCGLDVRQREWPDLLETIRLEYGKQGIPCRGV